ncbi:MAG: DUF4388 domain-containing protein [Nannocystaceae bacterium]
MAPELLIVGDVARRAELLERVRALGHDATLCSGPALERRIARGMLPVAVVVCIDDVEPRELMAELRRTRRGSGVPVTLYGPLGGGIGELADVLDLGADHFLEAPADDEQLALALEQLVGPGVEPPARTARRRSSGPARGAGSERDGGSQQTDAVLGQLHRTLDMLESRLRDRDRDEGDADDLELAELGFDELPSLGRPPRSTTAEAAPRGQPRRAAPRPVERPRHRDPTERLRRTEGAPPRPAVASPSARRRTSIPEAPPRSPLPIDERGELDSLEVPRLLWLLHRAAYTGAVSLRRGRVDKRLWWSDGQLLFAHGNTGHDRLADGLLRRGLLTRDQYEDASRIIEAEPRRATSRLAEAGMLKPAEVTESLRHHLVRIIDSTFGWTDGHWELRPDEACEDQALRGLAVARVIADGVRHRVEVTQLSSWLGGLDLAPRFRSEAVQVPQLVEQLLMTPAEEAWLARLDGRHTLRELAEGPGADELDLLGVAYTLHVLELLELRSDRIELSTAVEPSSIDVTRIRDRLRRSREGSYFGILELPLDACRIDVRRAHAQLRHTFADDQLEPDVREAMAAELEELRDLIDEARDVLIDEALRSAYLAHLEEP